MLVAVDLHAHSMFAGGAGGISSSPERLKESYQRAHVRFEDANITSAKKGIQVMGSGDIQFKPWFQFFQDFLTETENGLFVYSPKKKSVNDEDLLHYLLQTEIIVTTRYQRWRKASHVVILFPHLGVVREFHALLKRLGSKTEKMARPFVTIDTPEEVGNFFYDLINIDDRIEVIPAHILTPEGVFGGNNGVNRLEDFFGEFHKMIRIVETGLSADPEVIGLIPELDNRVLLSNSDAHSSALNRLAREFTVLNVEELSYDGIIQALREKKIEYTLEFPPTEGRFFFTGHRSGRKKPRSHGKSEFCYFSPDKIPEGNICPICGGELTKGVLHRAFEIAEAQGEKRSLEQTVISQRYVHGVPLIEAVAVGLGLKSISSKKVRFVYDRIIDFFGNEVNLWREDPKKVDEMLADLSVPENVKRVICEIKRDNFTFDPPGFDGQYGRLVVGKKTPYLGMEVINRKS